MSRQLPPRLPPLSLRLTFAERARLEEMAGGQSLASYIKEELFAHSGGPGLSLGLTIPVRTRRVRANDKLLAQVLAKLGDSQLGPSMAELAQAASSGSLFVSDVVERQLAQSCADIADMRLLLLEALGKRMRPAAPKPNNVTEAFNLVASGSIKPRASELSP